MRLIRALGILGGIAAIITGIVQLTNSHPILILGWILIVVGVTLIVLGYSAKDVLFKDMFPNGRTYHKGETTHKRSSTHRSYRRKGWF